MEKRYFNLSNGNYAVVVENPEYETYLSFKKQDADYVKKYVGEPDRWLVNEVGKNPNKRGSGLGEGIIAGSIFNKSEIFDEAIIAKIELL